MRASQLPRICQAAAVMGLAAVVGCTSTYGSRQSYRLVEPISPGWGGAAPLGAQPGLANRPVSPLPGNAGAGAAGREGRQESGTAGEEGVVTDPRGGTSDRDSATRSGVGESATESLGSDPESSAGKLTVPSIETEEILPIGTIDLTIEAPERAPVGRLVKFRVNSRNTLREAIEDVRVVCELQSGLEFPGFDTTELTAATPRLEAGESKQWELSLQSIRGGSLCCVFRLFHGGAGESAVIERKICIEFVEQQFAIEVIGPERRVEGGRAEYVLVIGNPSQERRERVRVQMSYDKALVLRESTEDVENGAAGLIWNLGGLDPGETRQLQAEFECQTAARRACIAVEVAADGLTPDRTEACLEIAPPGNVLDIQLSDRVEPIGVGRRGQYDMSVRNIGVNDARNVRIELQIPQEVELLSATLTIRGAAVDGQYTLRDGRLVFDTIERLRRDETIEGVIEIEAKQAGRVEMKASVTSSSEPTPATTAEPTLIEAPIGR